MVFLFRLVNNDVDETIRLVREVDEEMRNDAEFRNDILEPIEILGLDSFGDSAIVIKARTKTLPIRQWAVGREFHRRMKNRFDELGIEIPFPHQTVYFGVGKDGQAPPAHFQVGSAGDTQAAGLERLAAQVPKAQT